MRSGQYSVFILNRRGVGKLTKQGGILYYLVYNVFCDNMRQVTVVNDTLSPGFVQKLQQQKMDNFRSQNFYNSDHQ